MTWAIVKSVLPCVTINHNQHRQLRVTANIISSFDHWVAAHITAAAMLTDADGAYPVGHVVESAVQQFVIGVKAIHSRLLPDVPGCAYCCFTTAYGSWLTFGYRPIAGHSHVERGD